MQLPACGGFALMHFASERAACARSREGPEPPVLYGFASPEQLRLEEVCCTVEVPSDFCSSSFPPQGNCDCNFWVLTARVG